MMPISSVGVATGVRGLRIGAARLKAFLAKPNGVGQQRGVLRASSISVESYRRR